MSAGRIAVVGAGLAGLSAGLELKRRNFQVELFERTRLLGGKATSFEIDGVEVDNGQHVFLACCTEFIDFVREIEQLSSPRQSLLYLQDRFDAVLLARDRPPARLRAAPLPAPGHLALALLGYRHLGLSERIQVGRAVLAAGKPPQDGETFAAWLDRHHQSKRTREAFWNPFMVPALNAPLEDVSAESALFTIVTSFLSDAGAARFGYARVPLARIAERAAAALDEVHLRSPVAHVDVGDGVDPAVRGLILEDGSRLPFDGVVLAVPPARLKRVLERPEVFGVGHLDEFRHAPIVDVHLWYDRKVLGYDFAALLNSPIQWVFEKATGYLCCSMSAAMDQASASNADLVDLCRRELGELLPDLAAATFVRGGATRDPEATFVPAPGLRRPGAATLAPRVVLAGAWTDTGWPATMESAVRSGRVAARVLDAQMACGKDG